MTLNINFDGNSSGIYYPSQTISLLVELKVERTIKQAKGLRFRFFGSATVNWSEGRVFPVSYNAEQVFMNVSNFFFGKEGAEPVEVKPGVHLYKFSSKVPKSAPGSVSGKHGNIGYKVIITLESLYERNVKAEKSFTVVRHADLNIYPDLRIPSEVEEVKTFCCFICESNPVLLRVSTPRSGFALGEKIPVDITVFNRSGMKFVKSKLKLNRVEYFFSDSPVPKLKTNVVCVFETDSKEAFANTTTRFTELILVPSSAEISNDRVCEIFKICYEIHFSTKPLTRTKLFEATLPVVIGTIGLRMNSTSSSLCSALLPIEDCPPFCEKVQEVSTLSSKKFDFVL